MSAKTSKPKNYENHRENQRERILEAAEKLFIRDGINSVSITAIAKAARIARITLYEYFSNKEEIAWAILRKLIQENTAAAQLENYEGNGYQRLEQFMLQFVESVERYPQHTRFIVEFDSLYASQGDASQMVALVGEYNRNSPVARVLREGIADGSIRPDIDPDIAFAAIAQLVIGIGNRFALLGNHLSQEYGLPWRSIYLEIIHTYLRGIQAVPS